jgi:DNA recombination protein RmuC
LIEAILLIVGLIIGGAAGWYTGLMRGRGGLTGEVAGLSASLEEVRQQVAAREAEIKTLRETLDAEKATGVDSKARLEAAREHFAEQRRQIDEMEKKVKDTFAALSAAALKSNNEQFVTLADAKMKPLREQLQRYEKQIAELEQTRAKAYGGLSEQLEQMERQRKQLSRETQALTAALRQPGAKGRWGEAGLRNLMERTGMSPYCDFDEQISVGGADDRRRPDVVVRLPGGGSLVVDAKVNTSAYLDAVEATDEAEKERFLAKYAGEVRNTFRALGAKDYWRQFDHAPEFVVMFMPGEAFFAAAVSQDRDLISDSMDKGVLLASPTTLAALLMAIKHGWQQQQVAENAQQIAKAGRDLYDRLCVFVGHLDAVRGGLEKAGDAYNKAIGSWEKRTLPGVKKLKDLGADTGKTLADLKPTETVLRALPPAEEEEDART